MSLEVALSLILGSSVLTALAGHLINHFRPSRQSELLDAWINEVKTLEEIGESTPRRRALYLAGRSVVDANIATRMVPNVASQVAGLATLGLISITIGIVIFASQLNSNYDTPSPFLASVLALYIVMGIAVALLGIGRSHYSRILRTAIIKKIAALEGNDPLAGGILENQMRQLIRNGQPRALFQLSMQSDIRMNALSFISENDISPKGEGSSNAVEDG